jgi:hypothetical protein
MKLAGTPRFSIAAPKTDSDEAQYGDLNGPTPFRPLLFAIDAEVTEEHNPAKFFVVDRVAFSCMRTMFRTVLIAGRLQGRKSRNFGLSS